MGTSTKCESSIPWNTGDAAAKRTCNRGERSFDLIGPHREESICSHGLEKESARIESLNGCRRLDSRVERNGSNKPLRWMKDGLMERSRRGGAVSTRGCPKHATLSIACPEACATEPHAMRKTVRAGAIRSDH